MLSMEELSGIDMGIPEESIDEEEQEERNKLLLPVGGINLVHT